MFENLKFVSRANSNAWNENHLFWLFWCGNMKMIHSQKNTRHKEINNIASSAYFSVSTKQNKAHTCATRSLAFMLTLTLPTAQTQ